MLLTLYSEYMSTGWTHHDVLLRVFERLQVLCDESAAHPWQKDGYFFCLSACKGDLKWISDQYGLHNFRSNQPCSLCRVCKVAEDIQDTRTDFRPCARHLQTQIAHQDYVDTLDPEDVPVPMRHGIRCPVQNLGIHLYVCRFDVWFADSKSINYLHISCHKCYGHSVS